MKALATRPMRAFGTPIETLAYRAMQKRHLELPRHLITNRLRGRWAALRSEVEVGERTLAVEVGRVELSHRAYETFNAHDMGVATSSYACSASSSPTRTVRALSW